MSGHPECHDKTVSKNDFKNYQHLFTVGTPLYIIASFTHIDTVLHMDTHIGAGDIRPIVHTCDFALSYQSLNCNISINLECLFQ